MKKCNMIDWFAMVLVIVGAVNWGLIGLFDFNFVALFGHVIAKIAYILVGLAGLYMIYAAFRCGKGSCE